MIDLSSLLANWPQGVMVLDESHCVLYFNAKAADITGYSEEQLLQSPVLPWFEGQGVSLREEFVSGKLSYLLEHPGDAIPQWWLTASGEFIEVEARLSILDLPDQTVKLIAFDEFDDPEQSLFFIRKLAAFPTLSPQPLAQVGLDGSLEYSNERLNDLMLEYGFDELGHAKIFPSQWQEMCEQCLGNGPVTNVQHEVSGRWFNWNFHPVLEQSIPFVLMIATDVTDHIKHQRALESVNRLQSQSNKQKSIYMATLNSEMQTPLAEIQTHVDLLNLQTMTEQQGQWVRDIQVAANVLQGLVDDSEDRILLESNRFELRERAFNPRLVVSQTLEMLSPKISAKALKYYLWINPRLTVKTTGDPKRFGQICRILINNAVDFTERGAIVVQFQIRTMADKPWMRFSVTDSGVGMNQQKMSSVFSQTANFGHSLAFVKQIVNLMGGHVGVNSIEGRGSSFFVDLPCNGDETEPPVFRRAPNVAVNIADEIWNNTIEQYLSFAQVSIVEADQADCLITDQSVSDLVPVNIYIGSYAPKDNWDFILTCHTPPRLLFDVLESVVSEEKNKTVVELEKSSNETVVDMEPLNLTVLLVDDNENNLTVYSDVLAKIGCAVIVADSGDEALNQWFMSGGTIQLVLLDCKMPDMDGYQTAEALRQENFEGPIIGMTNRRWHEEIDDVIRHGMNSCTTKPLYQEELYNLILDIV